jgi:hypothetical protein
MGYALNIDEATGIARITLWGKPTIEEMMDVLGRLTAKGTFLTSKRLWDVRDATSTLTSDEMEKLARAALARDTGGSARVAIVTDVDVVYGLSRVFEVYRQSNDVEVRVFRDSEEAERWLEQ